MRGVLISQNESASTKGSKLDDLFEGYVKLMLHKYKENGAIVGNKFCSQLL